MCKMKSIMFISATILLSITIGAARQNGRAYFVFNGTPSPHAIEADAKAEAGRQNDPDYQAYQEGYRLVLNGQWQEAKKKFDGFLKKYPKSTFTDDARYWAAYAVKHYDRKSAVTAYVKFLGDFPNSRYFEDAVADLSELEKRNGHPIVIREATGSVGTPVPVPDADAPSGAVTVTVQSESRNSSPGAVTGYSMQKKTMASLEKALRRMRLPRAPFRFPGFWEDGEIDKATQVKMEALRALADSKDDTGSFTVLREVALDRASAKPLRIAAMEELSDRRSPDPLPVYLMIAKGDTDEQIQDVAFDQIGRCSSDKNRSVESLIDLFRAIPSNRAERRESVFYSIAEIGNDKAVDFLFRIAREDANYDLRSQAIYYLGSIGSPKAHTALYDLLREK
jgi:tetratricopeptide (TPR) repeat protein